MRIYTKLRWIYLVFSLAPLISILWVGHHTHIEQDPIFNQAMAAGVVAALFIGFAGPELTQHWIFLRQIKQIENFCRAVKDGDYDVSLPMPNETREKEDENEMVNLMRHLTWMAHRIGNREKELRRSLSDLAESHREIREKSSRLEQANSSLQQAHDQLGVQKTELEQAFIQMQRLAMTDPLTQIANRRSFFDALCNCLETAANKHSSISLLLLDIDHFKQINDQFGHQAGDRVLVELATRLRDCSGGASLVARIGGEEFALLLPAADTPAASEVAERIYSAINKQPFAVLDHCLVKVTASIGLCSLNSEGPYPTVDIFFCYADKALYHCKECGRDGVSCYDPNSHSIDRRTLLGLSRRKAIARQTTFSLT